MKNLTIAFVLWFAAHQVAFCQATRWVQILPSPPQPASTPARVDVVGEGWGYDDGNGCYWATLNARQKNRNALRYVDLDDQGHYCSCAWTADGAHQGLNPTPYKCKVTMRPSSKQDEMTTYGAGTDTNSAMQDAEDRALSFFGSAKKTVETFFCDQQFAPQHLQAQVWQCYGKVWIVLGQE
jgi:hypothetical protein